MGSRFPLVLAIIFGCVHVLFFIYAIHKGGSGALSAIVIMDFPIYWLVSKFTTPHTSNWIVEGLFVFGMVMWAALGLAIGFICVKTKELLRGSLWNL